MLHAFHMDVSKIFVVLLRDDVISNHKTFTLDSKYIQTTSYMIVVQTIEFIFEGVLDIMEKGENAGNKQHFLFFPTMFLKAFFMVVNTLA